MTDLYCPNCHRQLHELDIIMQSCPMCQTPFEVWEGVNKTIVAKLGTFDNIYEEAKEETDGESK